jgi:hypothetical protein
MGPEPVLTHNNSASKVKTIFGQKSVAVTLALVKPAGHPAGSAPFPRGTMANTSPSRAMLLRVLAAAGWNFS